MPNRGAAPSGAVKGQQRQLSVRDRQFIAAIRREAAAIEKETPGDEGREPCASGG